MDRRKYLAFDIEIAREIPPGTADWKTYRPFGIACAVAWASDSCSPAYLYQQAAPLGLCTGGSMTVQTCKEVVEYLTEMVSLGYTIVTWNGLGFDLDVLAEESGLIDECAALALDHIDMMFHFFCIKGFALSLNKAAVGAGLAGKTPGMTGEMAPALWANGKYEEVLRYCQQDVRTTLDLALAIENTREVRWTSNSGRPNVCPMPDGLFPVRRALGLPLPDTSSMANPWPRSKFTGWLGDRCPDIRPSHAHVWRADEDPLTGWYRIACDCGEVYAPRNLLRLLAKDGGESVAL